MNSTKYFLRSLGNALVLACAVAIQMSSAYAVTPLTPSNLPLANIDRALSNLMLTLSVEFPTGDAASYGGANAPTSATYSSATTYYGYFDPAKCYSYDTTNLYFYPVTCVSGTFKGNLLNWTSMANIDQFRQIMTGGNRIIDTTTATVLQRAYNDSQSSNSSGGYFPEKNATTADANVSTKQYYRSANMGDKMLVNGTSANSVSGLSSAQLGNDTCAQLRTDYKTANGSYPSWTCYHVRVKVCDPTIGLEANCTDYTSTGGKYKPEGLIQQYNQNMRVGAFGYVVDGVRARQGGVLRARMASLGPTTPDPISVTITNPNPEWSAIDGTFYANPDSTDQAATTSATASGVINYLNKFGYASAAVNGGVAYKGFDPMAELYYEALRYLRKISPTPQAISGLSASMIDAFPVINFDATVAANDPIQSACQQNFILMIGDVNNHCDTRLPGGSVNPACTGTLPTGDSVNFATATNAVAAMEPGSPAITSSDSPGRYAGWYLGGAAYWAHVNDIRPDKAAQRVAGKIQSVSSYFVDVLEPYNGISPVQTGATLTPMFTAAKYGGFDPTLIDSAGHPNNPNFMKTGSAIKSWDKDGNGTPDNWYAGNDPVGLRAGLSNVFQQIVVAGSLGDGAAPATSGVSQATAHTFYYASYSLTNGGRGALKACNYTATINQCDANPLWDSSAWLDPTVAAVAGGPPYVYQDNTTRQIITRSGGVGVPLSYAKFATADQTSMNINPVTKVADTPTLLGSQRVDYIRGDSTNEKSRTGGIFRTRLKTKLGDIVGSGPVYVQAPSAFYAGPLYAGYSDFQASNKNRNAVIYVGANDGMLHAFDATTTGYGKELFAYVPGYFLKTDPATSAARITALTNLTYTHQFYVDSTPMIGDVKFSTGWGTLLVGSYGAGGKGFFGLDVTDPTALKETNASTISKWEFSDSDDADMGYSFNQAAKSPTSDQPLQITKINDGTTQGKWAVIVGNGFGSSSGKAVLYFLSPDDGSVIKKIVIESTSGANGLATPLPVSTQFSGLIDNIWAGDLQGNMWRISWNATTNDWTVTKSFSGVTSQPITSAPAVSQHAAVPGAWAVVFGTGKYIERADYNTTTQQAIYGYADKFSSTPVTISDLVVQTTLTSTTPDPTTGAFTRTSSSNAVDFSTKKGWYMNLNAATGERSIVNPLIPADTGVVFVSSFVPASACFPGDGYINLLNAYSGAALPGVPSVGRLGMGIPYFSSVISSGGKVMVRAGGVAPGYTDITDPTTGAVITTVPLGAGVTTGTVSGIRFSWRQIR